MTVGPARRAPLRPVRSRHRRPPLRRHVHGAASGPAATRCGCCRRAAGATSRARPASGRRARRRSTSCASTCPATTCAASTGAARRGPATCSSSRWSTPPDPELVVVLDNRAATIGADDFEHAVEIAASILAGRRGRGLPDRAAASPTAPTTSTSTASRSPTSTASPASQLGDADSLTRLADVLVSRGRSLRVRHRRAVGPRPADDHQAGPRLLARLPRVGRRASATRRSSRRRGMRAIACADGADFVAHWTGLR